MEESENKSEVAPSTDFQDPHNNNNNNNVSVPSNNDVTEHKEAFFADIHKLVWGLKNKSAPGQEEKKPSTSLLKPVLGFLQVLFDWVVDFVVAGHHFYQGRHYIGGLTLFFVFIGGAFVTFDLNLLTRRKGHHEFKGLLRKISPVLLCLMYVPSFLPFFSSGLLIYLVHKLRKTSEQTEGKKIQRGIKICKEHSVIDTYYEGCYESFAQATLQLVILLEKPEYRNVTDFIPLLGVLSAWYGISTSPIQVAKALNNHRPKTSEIIAGLANKGVTLLSFALCITASRQHFAEDFMETSDKLADINWTVILASLIPVVVLTIFADLPGILLLRKELNSKKRRVTRKLELLMHFISLALPTTALIVWTLVMSNQEELDMPRYFTVLGIFMTGLVTAFLGYLFNEDLPWLGQFDTDILLLLYIGVTSFIKGNDFHDMDYQFSVTAPGDISTKA